MEYSEKEIAVFNGLIKLIKNGGNPYTIKVSDIAKAANIGKGTLYDYFSSKEEAISEALLYFMEYEIEYVCKKIDSKDNFRDKFYELLYVVIDSLKNNISIINILLSTGGIIEFHQYIIDEKSSIDNFLNQVNQLVEDLLITGYEEGIISERQDKFYEMMAIRSSLSGFSHYLSKKDCYKEIGLEQAMNTAYRLVLKTLN